VSVDVTADGMTAASGSKDTTAVLWDVSGKKPPARLEGHTGPVLVRFSPDGKTLATSSGADEFVLTWDVAMGKRRGKLTEHKKGVADVRFSPDGRTLAVRCGDQRVMLRNPASSGATND